ncbi:low-specificity L-threonine aldolase [Paludifilum halophilum]|uniref:Low-specificity L-threonine aldolase n=1 Tax=Paludifilum halophilum TaxID=1642702 RepID=A0A235BC58_9BACL|nr:low-specificity L-threonine aldolase [Paludifilum halophilum]OYD09609.1 low-specificity L-threonine aldolase [Paludifilum halophilum]
MIDLRSDTLTQPTPEMKEAMFQAKLGDDVYGEDPTVNQLEIFSADLLKKEAACFMPSGTMANLASILSHCPRGTKALVGNESDIYIYEAGGASVCGGVVYEPISTQPDGRLLLSDLELAFPEDMNDPQFALPSLLCLENTHNRCGGVILSPEYLEEVQAFANKKQIPVHMDGARLFHASISTGIPVDVIARHADSIQFCLSKGLCSPIGSMVVGSEGFIERVRRWRKMLGGGMRQAGAVAAAGIYSLQKMISRLQEDHQKARRFAESLSQLPGIKVNLETVQTNIVLFKIQDSRFTWRSFQHALQQKELLVSEMGFGRLRAVFHHDVPFSEVDKALAVVEDVLAEGPVSLEDDSVVH